MPLVELDEQDFQTPMDILVDKDAICVEKFTDQLYQWHNKGLLFIPEKFLTSVEFMEPVAKQAFNILQDGHAKS